MSFSEELRPPRKRNLADDVSLTNTTLKKALLESEQEKVELLRRNHSGFNRGNRVFFYILHIALKMLSSSRATSKTYKTNNQMPFDLLIF